MPQPSASRELSRLKEKAYWREPDGRAAVTAWRKSGLPLAQFAQQQGLSEQRIRWWRGRLGEGPSSPALAPADLVPVTIIDTPPRPMSRSTATMELVLASGHVLRVGADVDVEAVAKLVRALEGSC